VTDVIESKVDEGHLFAPAERLAELIAEMGTQPSGSLPDRLPLESITTIPDLFQPRAMSDRHISDLVRAIENNGEVDPVTVMQIGQRVVLIDGHHRIEAYHQAGRTVDIPVRFFDGSLEEAVLEAGQANSKVKLPMTSQERQDYAWRLVLLGKHSKADVAKASGVSPSSVANMRKVKKHLGQEAFDCRSWWQARERAQGRGHEMSEEDREKWKEEWAEKVADQLAKMFSTKLTNHPEVAAMALATYFGRRLPEVVNELQQHLPETGDDLGNDDF
jgi:ParB-like chromosome segregation protein Spo0J